MTETLAIYAAAATDKEFESLPEKHRSRVTKWAHELEWMDRALKQGKRLTGPCGLYSQMARHMGLSVTQVSRIIKRWQATQDWHVLLDGRVRNNKPVEDYGIKTPRFRAWAVRFAEHECRSSREAIRKIFTIFLYGGMTIDGYERHVPGTIPQEVNERALYRIFADHEKEIHRARFGMGAVRELPVLRDRSVLEPGQWYEMDDVMHDAEVMYRGQAVRVSEFGMFDYASACRIHWGHIPNFRRMSDDRRQALDRKMALMFLAYVLRYIGYHPEACVIMMEHRTATISEDKIKLLETATGGVLKVRKGGIKGAAQKAIGGRATRGKGNPQAKAGIEGSHNLIHNVQGNLPLQVGWTGRNEPAITWGMRREAEQVAFWQAALRAKGRDDLADKIDMPVMNFEDFTEYLTIKYALINGRTDHKISGWGRNKTIQYCIGNGCWVNEHDLRQSPEQKMMLQALVGQHPDLVRETDLSPADVWERGKGRLVRLPLAAYVDLIGDDRDFGRTVRVIDGLIRVQDKFCNNGEPIIYLAEISNDGQAPVRLIDRKEYRVVINPYALHELIVLDDQGRILGRAPQYVRVNPLSEDLYKTIGKVEARKAADMARQKARWQAENNFNASRHQANKDEMHEADQSDLGLITPSVPGTARGRRMVRKEDMSALLSDTPPPANNDESAVEVNISDLF